MKKPFIRYLWGLMMGLVMVGTLGFPQTSEALSCMEMPQTDEAYLEAYEEADVVFKGTLREANKNKFVFQVHTVMKGEADARIVVKDTTEDWLGEQMEKGQSYLVFGNHKRLHLAVSPCGATGEWDELKEYAGIFPNAKTMVYRDSNYETETKKHQFLLISSGIGAVLSFGAAIWWKRTR